jgi:hypothetical protein
MKLLSVTESPLPAKKLRATFQLDSGRLKHTDFGAAGMDDYTLTKNKDQRERYRTRHAKDLRTGDPTRAGFLSYWILWGPYTSRRENLEYYKRKYNL